MFTKKILLSRGYNYSSGRFNRYISGAGLVAAYQWEIKTDGASIVFNVPVWSFCVGRFGAGHYFGRFENKIEYSGAVNRPALLRWLYALGLSPVDCAKIADNVF